METISSFPSSPFTDEKLLQVESNFSRSSSGWLLWYEDLSTYPQVLEVFHADKLMATYLIEFGSSIWWSCYYWPLRDDEFEVVVDCFETIETSQASIQENLSGEDLATIKFAFPSPDEPQMLRLDRDFPPDCLFDVQLIAQESSMRRWPDMPLNIQMIQTQN